MNDMNEDIEEYKDENKNLEEEKSEPEQMIDEYQEIHENLEEYKDENKNPEEEKNEAEQIIDEYQEIYEDIKENKEENISKNQEEDKKIEEYPTNKEKYEKINKHPINFNINIKKYLSPKLILAVVALILLVLAILLFQSKGNSKDFLKLLKEKGFTDLNEHFVCDAIKENSKLIMSTRKYSFITIDGEVYNISFSATFNENQNCEKRDFSTKLKAHVDNIIVGEDNKYYSVYENLVPKEDITFPYDIKDVVQKVDKYILKKDGNIYYLNGDKLSLKYKGSSFKGKIQNISLINSDYSEEDEKKIVVLTDKAVYYSYSDKEKECRKYANKKCSYGMEKDKFLSKYRNKLLYIDDTIIITKDGKVLYTNNYFGA